jgi:hypothetical protein
MPASHPKGPEPDIRRTLRTYLVDCFTNSNNYYCEYILSYEATHNLILQNCLSDMQVIFAVQQ